MCLFLGMIVTHVHVGFGKKVHLFLELDAVTTNESSFVARTHSPKASTFVPLAPMMLEIKHKLDLLRLSMQDTGVCNI